ncbi:MAG: hypothetical protein WD355_01510 [Balneolaceae bacterium]
MNPTNHLFSIILIGITFLVLGFTLLSEEEGVKYFFLLSGTALLVYASVIRHRSGGGPS